MRERMKSLTFADLLPRCALTVLLLFPILVMAETNLRAADQIVRQAKGWNAAGKYEGARAALVRYLERDSRSVVARLEYARTLSYLREFTSALAEYQHVLTLEPRNHEARVGVAKVASFRGEFETALLLYNRILEEVPGLHDALVGKAHTLLWLGRKEEATAVFLDAWPRNPSDREVRRMLEELGIDPEVALQEARIQEARLKAASHTLPEPTLAVLPDQIALPEVPGWPTAERAAPASPVKSAPTSAAQVRRKPAGAPPPAPLEGRTPVPVSPPAPLPLQAATLLILLAGGALAYRTHVVFTRRVQVRSRPLPVTRPPFQLPPSSLFAEAIAAKSEPAAQAVPKATPKPAAKIEPAVAAAPTEKTQDADAGTNATARAAEPSSTEAPKVAAPAKVAPPNPTPPAPPTRPDTLLWGRVLVVHPDEQVLDFTRRVLAGAGAEVLALRRGEDALVRLEKSHAEHSTYDALLVNDRLPGGWTGMEIYRWVKQHQPGAERSLMLVHSGEDDTHTQQFLEESGALGVTAPFNVSDLIAMTRLALDKSKAAPRA